MHRVVTLNAQTSALSVLGNLNVYYYYYYYSYKASSNI